MDPTQIRMAADLEVMQQATETAWLVTSLLGLVAGWFAFRLFRSVDRLSKMTVLSGLIAFLFAFGSFVALSMIRYRIEEAPFEPPVWIDPGLVSVYLPAAAILAGTLSGAVISHRRSRIAVTGPDNSATDLLTRL